MATEMRKLGTLPVIRGDYEDSTLYYKHNLVRYHNQTYQYKSDTPSSGNNPKDTNYWSLFAGGFIYGTTQERPILQQSDIGYMYYDTTLCKPIFWDGNRWLDTTGKPLDLNTQGPTSQRPIDPPEGFSYFDIDLIKPIWYSFAKSEWVDANGKIV